MPQISSVYIAGFQSHTESRFTLGPGLTVITGPSDSGKTAIIRAVRWVAFGEPSGDDFVNKKTGEAIVSIVMDNGVIVSKRRKSKKTSYQLQMNAEDDGQVFEKAEVPEEVKLALGINKQTFGDFVTALNFAFQLEAPFLISETASAGAKILGKLAGTEEVDGAIKDVSKDTYQARQERSKADYDISELNTQLLEFAGLEQARQQLEAVEYLVEEVERDVEKLGLLKKWDADLEVITDNLNRQAEKLDKLANVLQLEDDLKDVEKVQQHYDMLLDLYEKLDKATATVETLTQQLESYSELVAASDLMEVITDDQGRLNLLISITQRYEKYTTEENNQLLRLVRLEETEEAAAVLPELENSYIRERQLLDLELHYNKYENDRQRTESTLAGLQELTQAQGILQELTAHQKQIEALEALKTDYGVKAAQENRRQALLLQTQGAVKEAQEELNNAWEAAGGKCPLCEQPAGRSCSHA